MTFAGNGAQSHFTTAHVHHVLQAAQQAAQSDHRDVVHAIRYGAAAALLQPDEESSAGALHISQAAQRKALEYGATQDAVTQLMSLWMNDGISQQAPAREAPDADSTGILFLLAQVDQFGVVHAPFAMARSFLVEHGWGDLVQVVVPAAGRDDPHHLAVVPARVLAPHVPVWK